MYNLQMKVAQIERWMGLLTWATVLTFKNHLIFSFLIFVLTSYFNSNIETEMNNCCSNR